LHAATLVTAGIYLLLRSSPILEYSPTALLVITLIGATTAFLGASVGLVSNDLKRIIAMSTISQLGYFFVFFFIIIIIFYFTLDLSEVSDFTYYQSTILPLSSVSNTKKVKTVPIILYP
jgi:formate hydrogenlyase subunit 3/multisubunit Na+/H+ antiporter MnhD subunit